MRDQRTAKPHALQRTSTPCIYRRGCSGRYTVIWRDGGGKQRGSSAPTLAAARDLQAKVRTAVKEGHYMPQESKPFDAWADEWLASLERKATTR
jgi:hypothetical protein